MLTTQEAQKLRGYVSRVEQMAKQSSILFATAGRDESRQELTKAKQALNEYIAKLIQPVEPGEQEAKTVEAVLFSTKDPTVQLFEPNDVPAMTTMLFKVCGHDHEKFDEAMRLVTLFIENALGEK